MKKFCLILFFCVAAMSANAQLKVYSNGNVGVDRTQLYNFHTLTIGDRDILDGGYNIKLFSNTKKGWTSFNIAVEGNSANPYNTSNRSIGVRGIAGNGSNGYNYGIIGGLGNSANGAGIFGTIYNHTGVFVNGQYAGYFDGETKVSGNLTVTGNISGNLLSNAIPSSQSNMQFENVSKSVISEKLYNIPTISYYKEKRSEESIQVDNNDTIAFEPKIPLVAQQDYNKIHYSLAIEQLEQAFPELIYELENGDRAINYIEMIPLLVQSMNELKAEIAILKGESISKSRSSDIGETVNMVEVQNQRTAVTLYQNTPNPFTERTTIRFSLPRDTKNAYIYIFDMTGKMQKQIPVDASMQSITINGYELSAGMYIYSLVVNGKEMDTKRMILSK